MNAITVKVTQGGRLVIPASVRKMLNLVDGETLLLEVHGHKLEVEPLKDRLAAVQRECSALLGKGVVDEFLAERRAEAAKENR